MAVDLNPLLEPNLFDRKVKDSKRWIENELDQLDRIDNYENKREKSMRGFYTPPSRR